MMYDLEEKVNKALLVYNNVVCGDLKDAALDLLCDYCLLFDFWMFKPDDGKIVYMGPVYELDYNPLRFVYYG